MNKLVFDAGIFTTVGAEDIERLVEEMENYRMKGFQIVLNLPGDSFSTNGETNIFEIVLGEYQELAKLFDCLTFAGPALSSRGLHLDDKGINKAEFLNLSHDDLLNLLEEQ